MAIKTGSNVISLRVQREQGENLNSLASSFERLSSGLRINKVSDDAASLALAESLRTETRIYSQGYRNISDGISAVKLAEEASDALNSILLRQKEIASQATSNNFSQSQRNALQQESNALTSEFNRIVTGVTANNRALLDGSAETLNIQVGGSSGINVSFAQNISSQIFSGNFDEYSQVADLAFKFSTGDLNSDGKTDLIGRIDAEHFGISFGNGDGTFNAQISYLLPFSLGAEITDQQPYTIDLDSDGDNDVVIADSATGNIVTLIGNGNGTFQAARSFSSGSVASTYLSFTDFNNDNKLDVITSDSKNDGTVSILIGNGDGTFQAGINFAGSEAKTGGGFGDINNDGFIDLLINDRTNASQLYLGNGDGTFKTAITLAGITGHTTSIDVDGDGASDLFSIKNDDILLSYGNGDGTFTSAITLQNDVNGRIELFDFNNDGLFDIFTSDVNEGNPIILLNNGDGTFKAGQSFLPFGDPSFVTRFADLNNDGTKDAIGYHLELGVRSALTRPVRSSTVSYLNLSSTQASEQSVSRVEESIKALALDRSELNAASNRLESALRTSENVQLNNKTALSRITDIDLAEETAQQLRLQIVQQLGPAIQAQANLQPQLVLSLLSNNLLAANKSSR